MKKLRAAVVGVGYLGAFHAQKYKNNPQSDLVGVFDINRMQAQKVANALSVGVFEKLEDLPGKVDVATIATSTQNHFEVAEFLIQNGIHLNIEKPITADLSQAHKLIDLASKKNVKITVGHIERFNPAFLKWRLLMGTSKYIEFERCGPFKARGADVSVIHDLMIHDIDLLLSLNPGPIINLEARGAKLMSQTIDWAVVWLSFSNLKVCLKASRVSPIPARLIKSYDDDSHWTVYLNNGELDRVRFHSGLDASLVSERIATDKVDALQKETDAFVDAIINNREPLISGRDGLVALELVERICSELSHV